MMKTKRTNLVDSDIEDGDENDGEESNDAVIHKNDDSNTSRNPATTVPALATVLNDPRHVERKKNQTKKASRKRQKNK